MAQTAISNTFGKESQEIQKRQDGNGSPRPQMSTDRDIGQCSENTGGGCEGGNIQETQPTERSVKFATVKPKAALAKP